MHQLCKWIMGKDHRQLRFGFALWTREMVRDLIFERYGVHMTLEGVDRVLRRLWLSAQRPLVGAYEQDPERVRRFKEEEYPKIVKREKEVGAQIFFSEEACVRSDYHSGTTWGEIGHTPVVRST